MVMIKNRESLNGFYAKLCLKTFGKFNFRLIGRRYLATIAQGRLLLFLLLKVQIFNGLVINLRVVNDLFDVFTRRDAVARF